MGNTSSPVQSTVLLGYGSVGKYHAQLLGKRYRELAIVEINQNVREQASTDYPTAIVAPGLTELSERGWKWDDTLAVIATWGPSHAAMFSELAELGVRHILCEKPLAHSVKAGAKMVAAARDLGIALGVHQRHRYSGLVSGLKRLADDFGMGEPGSVVVHGGALGLVTNGIHYINVVCELFDAGPESVSGSALGQPLNPRSPELHFYGGTAVWSFSGGREATMSFSNLSSLSLSASIYYRNALIKVDVNMMEVEVWCRDAAQIAKYPAVTRTGQPSEMVFQGPVPGVRPSEECTSILLDEIESNRVRLCPPQLALQALGSCIGALSSGRNGCRVTLPIDPDSELGRQEWPIS